MTFPKLFVFEITWLLVMILTELDQIQSVYSQVTEATPNGGVTDGPLFQPLTTTKRILTKLNLINLKEIKMLMSMIDLLINS